MMRRCLYNRDAFEYVFEFGKKFFETYKDEQKIISMNFLDAHEPTGQNIKTMDDGLESYL
jgi:hypothetical protein